MDSICMTARVEMNKLGKNENKRKKNKILRF